MHFYDSSIFTLTNDGGCFLFYLLVQIAVVHAGSKTTNEARKTSVIFSQIINNLNPNDSMKTDFIFFIGQANSRDLNLQNKLFLINWSTLVTVSCGCD
jgi:mannitol/fructose-specific phosphotransferase system IIA component